MIPSGLKVGETFKDGNSLYRVRKIVPLGYESEKIKANNAVEQPLPGKKEVKAEVKEDAPAKLDSFNKYTKTEINRLNNAELEKVCDKLGLEKSTGMAMKKAIIEKLGL